MALVSTPKYAHQVTVLDHTLLWCRRLSSVHVAKMSATARNNWRHFWNDQHGINTSAVCVCCDRHSLQTFIRVMTYVHAQVILVVNQWESSSTCNIWNCFACLVWDSDVWERLGAEVPTCPRSVVRMLMLLNAGFFRRQHERGRWP